MRKLFRVSTKAAVFDTSREKVVVVRRNKSKQWKYDAWDLPGGHLEDNEEPEIAISRELMEECGIKCENLQKAGFFLHNGVKVVLAYTGTIENQELVASDGEEDTPLWLTKEEFMKLNIGSAYRDLVLSSW